MLSEQDLKQISQRGISKEQVEHQLEQIKNGFPFLRIEAAAAVGKGIMKPTEEESKAYAEEWGQYLADGHEVVKFVPASGAASRMFKNLLRSLTHPMTCRQPILRRNSSTTSNILPSVRLYVRNARPTRA